MERNLPALEARLGTFRRLAERIGPERVIWRYDPYCWEVLTIFRFHTGGFRRVGRRIEGYTERCMIGFLDFYRHIRKVMDEAGAGAPSPGGYGTSGRCFQGIRLRSTASYSKHCTSKWICGVSASKRLLYRRGIGGAADGVSALRPEVAASAA